MRRCPPLDGAFVSTREDRTTTDGDGTAQTGLPSAIVATCDATHTRVDLDDDDLPTVKHRPGTPHTHTQLIILSSCGARAGRLMQLKENRLTLSTPSTGFGRNCSDNFPIIFLVTVASAAAASVRASDDPLYNVASAIRETAAGPLPLSHGVVCKTRYFFHQHLLLFPAARASTKENVVGHTPFRSVSKGFRYRRQAH